MSNQTLPLPRPVDVINSGLGRRRAAERRFRLYGVAAITLALIFLVLLFISIIGKGYTAFWQTQVQMEATLAPELLDIADPADRNQVMAANYGAVMKAALRQAFPEVTGRAEQRQLFALVSSGAEDILRQRLLDDPSLLGQTVSVWVPAGGDIDMVRKGHIDRSLPESERRVSDQELAWMDALVQQGRIEQRPGLGRQRTSMAAVQETPPLEMIQVFTNRYLRNTKGFRKITNTHTTFALCNRENVLPALLNQHRIAVRARSRMTRTWLCVMATFLQIIHDFGLG